jgi:hypothetical protein
MVTCNNKRRRQRRSMIMKREGYISLLVASAALLALITIARAQTLDPQSAAGVQAPIGTSFTYQGQLDNAGSPVTDACDFDFGLWDAQAEGAQIGSTQKASGVGVSNGRFTVQLDFGDSAFTGEARWLQIAVQCSGDAGFTALSPRQPLTPAPYALALPGLYTQHNAASPNVIGGYSGNSVTSGAVGATIGGGGANLTRNRVTDDYGTVGGGGDNTAGDWAGTTSDVQYPTVGGGHHNRASGDEATVGGGENNTASNTFATVAGGCCNNASNASSTVGGGSGNTASGTSSTVGGGMSNTAGHGWTTVGGGKENIANGLYAAVGGGYHNAATGSYAAVSGGYSNTVTATHAFIGAGASNTVAGAWGSVGAGISNTITGDYGVVGGGYFNRVTGTYGFVGGGLWNRAGYDAAVAGGSDNVADGASSFIGAGSWNAASGTEAVVSGGDRNAANGNFSTVPGGRFNRAEGVFAFAAGLYARAVHDGTFVWGDFTSAAITSTKTNQFVIRASNGVSLSVNAGHTKAISIGERYRDNAIVAWAKIQGGAVMGTADFGVADVDHAPGSGIYTITLDVSVASAGHLIPVAVAEVDAPPVGAANVRIVSIDQVGVDKFLVYINNGNWALVDNDFVFLVTAR